ncbi:MAG TPA: signal peptidase I [Ktedonobacteraceae bacterium]|jgi:signal peptidase I|nr:signal peptidase I [Ktedonobacteraceae bacterium]
MSSSENSLPGKSTEQADDSQPQQSAKPVDDNQPQQKTETKAPAKKSSSSFSREILETVALTVLIFLAIRFTVQNFQVDGPSMRPGLHTGEYVLVNKLAYTFHQPARGDVIVFELPGDPSENLIKRVIGLPGDKLVITPNSVTINGVTINEPYISAPNGLPAETVTVPANEYFVMGDNRPVSDDSRDWGFLPRDDIIGEAVMVYWPISDWESINTYSSVYAHVKP